MVNAALTVIVNEAESAAGARLALLFGATHCGGVRDYSGELAGTPDRPFHHVSCTRGKALGTRSAHALQLIKASSLCEPWPLFTAHHRG